MDYDGHSRLLEFDANYRDLCQRCYCASVEPVSATALPQGSSRPNAADHFLSKFEAMEKTFREEFISTGGSGTDETKDDGDRGGLQTQVDMTTIVNYRPVTGTDGHSQIANHTRPFSSPVTLTFDLVDSKSQSHQRVPS